MFVDPKNAGVNRGPHDDSQFEIRAFAITVGGTRVGGLSQAPYWVTSEMERIIFSTSNVPWHLPLSFPVAGDHPGLNRSPSKAENEAEDDIQDFYNKLALIDFIGYRDTTIGKLQKVSLVLDWECPSVLTWVSN